MVHRQQFRRSWESKNRARDGRSHFPATFYMPRKFAFPSQRAAKSFISLRPYRPNWNNSWHFSMLNSSENAAIMGYPMRASRFVLSAVCVGAVSVAVAQNASDSLPSAPSAVIQEEQKKAQAPPPAATRAAPAPQAQEKPTELTNTPPAPVSNPPNQQEPPAATTPAPTHHARASS